MKNCKAIFILVTSLLVINKTDGQTLSEKLSGKWVNTSLFDSTRIKMKLSPWIGEFYGSAAVEVSGDLVALFGCMDGDPTPGPVTIIDASRFKFSNLGGEPTFEYLQKSDMLRMTQSWDSTPILFRRVSSKDKLDIITDEDKFETYFKSLFFDKYIKVDNSLQIDRLWIGFLTHTPFEFDAFGVLTKDGDIQYFGWEQTENMLRIYFTTKNTDNDSGFYYWTKGKLKKEIKLK